MVPVATWQSNSPEELARRTRQKNSPEELARERFHISTGFHPGQRDIIAQLVQGKRLS